MWDIISKHSIWWLRDNHLLFQIKMALNKLTKKNKDHKKTLERGKKTWNFVYTKTLLKTANVWSISVSQVMFLTHDLSNVTDDFRGTYHLNKMYVKYSWHHFTSYQFFPFDWYNLNISQEKKYWRVNRSRRLKDQNNIAFMTPYKVQYFSWPWNRCWLNVAFVYSVWHYNRKSKTALNIALNLFWKLTVSETCLH